MGRPSEPAYADSGPRISIRYLAAVAISRSMSGGPAGGDDQSAAGSLSSTTNCSNPAGIERATVYRHFPHELSLFTACTQHYNATHPPPDPAPCREISPPETRLRVASAEIYAYYRRTERMTERATEDVRTMPVLREVLAPSFAYWGCVREALAVGWLVTDAERGVLVTAAVGHAIRFRTWQSLVREQGLADDQAIEAMVGMVRCLIDGPRSTPRRKPRQNGAGGGSA